MEWRLPEGVKKFFIPEPRHTTLVKENTTEGKKSNEIDYSEFDPPVSRHDVIKSGFIDYVVLFVPFILAVLLAVSNGYFFSGFKDFDIKSLPITLAWTAGFALEAICLAAIFHASIMLKNGKKVEFWRSMIVALLLGSISFLTQYIYLQLQVHELVAIDTAIEKTPLFSILVGFNGLKGHDILFIIRSAAFHVGEMACAFLISKKGKDLQTELNRRNAFAMINQSIQTSNMVEDMQKMLLSNMRLMMENQQRQLQAKFDVVTTVNSPVVDRVITEEDTVNFTTALPNQNGQHQ